MENDAMIDDPLVINNGFEPLEWTWARAGGSGPPNCAEAACWPHRGRDSAVNSRCLFLYSPNSVTFIVAMELR